MTCSDLSSWRVVATRNTEAVVEPVDVSDDA
jgi:hypothetical protein